MKIGDLVTFQNCVQQGKAGIITMLTKPSLLAKVNPSLRLYWVLSDTDVQCFTGNQLRLV